MFGLESYSESCVKGIVVHLVFSVSLLLPNEQSEQCKDVTHALLELGNLIGLRNFVASLKIAISDRF